MFATDFDVSLSPLQRIHNSIANDWTYRDYNWTKSHRMRFHAFANTQHTPVHTHTAYATIKYALSTRTSHRMHNVFWKAKRLRFSYDVDVHLCSAADTLLNFLIKIVNCWPKFAAIAWMRLKWFVFTWLSIQNNRLRQYFWGKLIEQYNTFLRSSSVRLATVVITKPST